MPSGEQQKSAKCTVTISEAANAIKVGDFYFSDATTPSVVYFESETNVIVGKEAKNMLPVEPEKTVSFIKRQIGDDLGKLDPALFCHDCRALMAETASEGYVLLDMYDLENIQAFVIEDGAEHSIRDYTVSIYKDKENGGLSVEVAGHLFEAE